MGRDIVKGAFAAEVRLGHLLNEKLKNYEATSSFAFP